MSADRITPQPPGDRRQPSSAGPEPVAVGRILRAHGVRGEVVVESWSDVADRFAVASRVWAAGEAEPLEIATSRRHRGLRLIRFAGVDDRDAAERLRGLELVVPVDAVPAAPAESYYYFELVGCRVEDLEVGELGTVADVLEDGGGLLLEIESIPATPAGERLLVPFVASYVRKIDVVAKRIRVSLPAGLLDTCRST